MPTCMHYADCASFWRIFKVKWSGDAHNGKLIATDHDLFLPIFHLVWPTPCHLGQLLSLYDGSLVIELKRFRGEFQSRSRAWGL